MRCPASKALSGVAALPDKGEAVNLWWAIIRASPDFAALHGFWWICGQPTTGAIS
ncbi:MAG: hypothetical protein WD425_21725 [Nitrospirales bacterium]